MAHFPMQGGCLCGAIRYSLLAPALSVQHCHCSLCRRQSGTASNCASIVEASRFRWLRGASSITSWTKPTGYRSDFCSRCGSPAPNPLRSGAWVWVPAGLLDDPGPLEIVADFHLGSKAEWDTTTPAPQAFDGLPSLEDILGLLHDA